MRVAIECAGFTPGEADMLRKSMATFKFTGGVSAFKDKLVSGMVARGYEADFAERTFRQLEGFGSYGFPESHAASFALVAYASAWLKCWHPDAFCAALLNSQPMGFYAPAQIVRDAQEHGVEIRPICANTSRWDCTLEPTGRPEDEGSRFALRLGLRMIKGLANSHAASFVAARANQPFASIEDLWRRVRVPIASLTRIAEADGFRPGLGLSRREALWALKGLGPEELPLFAAARKASEWQEDGAIADAEASEGQNGGIEPAVTLRSMTLGREVVEDYGHTGLSLRRHPVSFLRDTLGERKFITCAEAMASRDRRWCATAGLVLVRQRPGSAKGVMFVTIEDETGVANLVVWPKVFEAHRRIVLGAGMIGVQGRIQREGEVVHFVVHRIEDLSRELADIGQRGIAAFPLPYGRGDEVRHGSREPNPRGQAPEGPKPRDIYVRDRLCCTNRMRAGVPLSLDRLIL